MNDEKLTDEELADVAARIADPRCHVCDGDGHRVVNGVRNAWRDCGMCGGTGNLALSTETMAAIIAELRAHRQAALSEEEREALRWAAWMCCDGKKPTGGDYHEAVPLIRAALTRLVEQKL